VDHKKHNKDDGVKNIKEETEGVHVQKHKGNDAYAKHDNKELNAPLFHVPNAN
jgi:hypothetical protein